MKLELVIMMGLIAAYFFQLPSVVYLAIALSTLIVLSVRYGRAIKTVEQLTTSVEKIKNTISGTSEQIKGSCSLLDESTSSQSSAIFESSAASDEISAMLNRSAMNVKQVSDSAISINDIIEVSSKYAKLLDDNFLEVQQTNEGVIELIRKTVGLLQDLTSSFNEVVSKTGVINDIVFQTKLLSFNASVEAARAGEHGKGFAVVAEEIGNLAQMSGESAKAINVTLTRTDAQVVGVIETMRQAGKDIEEKIKVQSESTTQIMQEFKDNFANVKTGTQSIGRDIESVSQASEEQARGVSELRSAIHEVNESVQKNTLVVAQTLKLATVLNDEMGILDQIIGNFKISLNVETDLSIEEIPWEDKYAIGVKDMDEDHIDILDGINALIRAMNEKAPAKMKDCFQSLFKVTSDHFSVEEDFMERIEYPSFASHKKVHENLLNKLKSFEPQIAEGSVDAPTLASFLRNWLFTHIMGIDTKYAEHHHKTMNSRHFSKAS